LTQEKIVAKRCSTALEAIECIDSGENIWVHSMAATPVLLVEALAEHAKTKHHLTVLQLHLENAQALCSPQLEGHLRNRVFFAGRGTRDLVNEGRADYVPMFLSEIPKLFRRREQQIDTAIVQVSVPDRHGNCSLGISVEATKAACESAGKIIAQINPNMPRTHGESFIKLADIDYYEATSPLITINPRGVSPLQRRIGEYAASLIENGDCLQMGVGAIPDAVISCLGDRKHLGVHTEMFSDGILPLIESGAIDNSRKVIRRGKVVTGFAMGSAALYEYVDDNPSVEFLDIEYVNNPAVISRNNHVVSINSAIQIDLGGQVCADSIGTKIYSGVGGQLDFVLGATLSEGGKSIIALPASAQKGAVSRLVSTLDVGAGVVTTRAHVDYVITEYGIAELRGRSLAERANALIKIAHPDFKETLAREAHEILGLYLPG